ncbi:MAG: aminoglycoside phosphotransferase family protein [Bacteroidales bacterium]|jgi:Ser/Thr protein kinase RdoA (MazF antagonist)|nr:aminoglycoside phosphotransferase family protein [Bacteroidales bacterium]
MEQFDLHEISSHFLPKEGIESVAPLGEGFINDTFVVGTKGGVRYLLQRKNRHIFTDVPAMMDNIAKVTAHLKRAIIREDGDPLRETLTLTPTVDGKLYHVDAQHEYWAMCLFIAGSRSYETVDSSEIACCGGKGVGKFQRMLVDFHEPLADILPGFHNIRFRYQQWDRVIRENPAGRNARMKTEIEWIESRRNEMLSFWQKVEQGIIPSRVVHNDTKISNILFDSNGAVLGMIDLDTVQQNTVLNDFGDAIRSYTNTGAEDEKDLTKVNFDIERFHAFTTGYLEEAAGFLTAEEVEYLPFAGRYITFEQVLRFLMDYLDGDHYYKIKYPEHNLIRTLAQYKLLTDMETRERDIKDVVCSLAG